MVLCDICKNAIVGEPYMYNEKVHYDSAWLNVDCGSGLAIDILSRSDKWWEYQQRVWFQIGPFHEPVGGQRICHYHCHREYGKHMQCFPWEDRKFACSRRPFTAKEQIMRKFFADSLERKWKKSLYPGWAQCWRKCYGGAESNWFSTKLQRLLSHVIERLFVFWCHGFSSQVAYTNAFVLEKPYSESLEGERRQSKPSSVQYAVKWPELCIRTNTRD